jgi:hypothetical protein
MLTVAKSDQTVAAKEDALQQRGRSHGGNASRSLKKYGSVQRSRDIIYLYIGNERGEYFDLVSGHRWLQEGTEEARRGRRCVRSACFVLQAYERVFSHRSGVAIYVRIFVLCALATASVWMYMPVSL